MIKLIKPVIVSVKEGDLYVDKTDKSGAFTCKDENDLVSRGFAKFVENDKTVSASTGKKRKATKE